jgi:cell wall-associated NlpC family hydrolase
VKTIGLDCSGFTRWVLDLIMGRDVLGTGNTTTQYNELAKVTDADAAPGDLVFYRDKSGWDHVGILIAPGVIIDEPTPARSENPPRARPCHRAHCSAGPSRADR